MVFRACLYCVVLYYIVVLYCIVLYCIVCNSPAGNSSSKEEPADRATRRSTGHRIRLIRTLHPAPQGSEERSDMGGARDRHPSLEGREEGSEARARSYQAARLGRPGSARQALHHECAKNANNSNSSRDSGVYPAGATGFGQNVTAGRQPPGRSLI